MKNFPTITRVGLIINILHGFLLFFFVVPLIMAIWSIVILNSGKRVSTLYLVLNFLCCSFLGFVLVLIGQTIEEQAKLQKVYANEQTVNY